MGFKEQNSQFQRQPDQETIRELPTNVSFKWETLAPPAASGRTGKRSMPDDPEAIARARTILNPKRALRFPEREQFLRALGLASDLGQERPLRYQLVGGATSPGMLLPVEAFNRLVAALDVNDVQYTQVRAIPMSHLSPAEQVRVKRAARARAADAHGTQQ